MIAEEQDLVEGDFPDPDPPWTSQYEIQEIPDQEYYLEEEFHPPTVDGGAPPTTEGSEDVDQHSSPVGSEQSEPVEQRET